MARASRNAVGCAAGQRASAGDMRCRWSARAVSRASQVGVWAGRVWSVPGA